MDVAGNTWFRNLAVVAMLAGLPLSGAFNTGSGAVGAYFALAVAAGLPLTGLAMARLWYDHASSASTRTLGWLYALGLTMLVLGSLVVLFTASFSK